MSETQTLPLGFIAGVTILIGLPLGRVRAPRPGTRQFLNALAIGILLFLFWDVLVHAFEPVDNALVKLHDGTGGIARSQATPPCSSWASRLAWAAWSSTKAGSPGGLRPSGGCRHSAQ